MTDENKTIEQPTLPFGPEPPAPAGEKGQDALDLIKSENEQLKAMIGNAAAHREITGELERIGARSPELLWDVVAGRVEFDDEGRPANVAAVVAELKAKFPEQFGTYIPQSIDGGAGQTATPRLTKEALRRMKPAEIAELDWADVRRVLAS
ncbi:MAG: hypothetical protein IPO41_10620 [Acidobacteria bacterium]|nr:hypothetical protein [Acidobacteriota bacterium]MBK9528750.1 hypothetical protein [Acidobacteriota bacterium]